MFKSKKEKKKRKDDQEFHFTVRDNSGDEITIRNYWGMHYLIYVYKTVPTEIRTTIVLEYQPIAMKFLIILYSKSSSNLDIQKKY